MSTPTEGEVQTQISNYVDILNDLLTNATATLDLLGMIDTFEQSLEGDYLIQAAAGARAIRAGYAGSLNSGAVKAGFDALWMTYGRVRNFPETTPEGIIIRLYRYMHDNSKTIKERNFTFGTPAAAGGNVGNGTLSRLNFDADGYEIEVGLAESFEAECVQDQLSTGIHEEIFRIRSSDRSADGLERLGTGTVAQIQGVSARRSLIRNASFTSGTSGSSVTDFDVSAGAVAGTAKNTVTTYRSAGVGDTATSLAFTAACTLQQKISTTGVKLRADVPYVCQIAYNRSVGAGTGTLVLGMGAATATVATLSGAGAGWNILQITLNAANSWLKGFKENDLEFYFGITAAGEAIGGTTYIDDFIVAPMTPVRGQFYSLVGGSTPFLLRDSFSWSDTLVEAKIQYWIYRMYGLYLPAGAAPTWADP